MDSTYGKNKEAKKKERFLKQHCRDDKGRGGPL